MPISTAAITGRSIASLTSIFRLADPVKLSKAISCIIRLARDAVNLFSSTPNYGWVRLTIGQKLGPIYRPLCYLRSSRADEQLRAKYLARSESLRLHYPDFNNLRRQVVS